MPFDRRHLLSQGAALSVALACSPSTRPKSSPKDAGPTEPLEEERGVSGPVAATLAAVSARIIPADELGPGADAAGVGSYIEQTLRDPRMKHLIPLLSRGAGFLNRAAQVEHKVGYFPALTGAQQDDILQRMADGKMRPNRFRPDTFIRVMIALTLEGYLGDPSHGGNRDEAGWKSLGYSMAGRNQLVHIQKEGKGT